MQKPKRIHDEIYRGIRFVINDTEVGVIGVFEGDGHRNLINGDYVSRYFTREELIAPAQPHIMRAAIDRMYQKRPIYTGDIREQLLIG